MVFVRDVVRDSVCNHLVDVITEAIHAGIGVHEFKRMCAIAWREAAELIGEDASALEKP